MKRETTGTGVVDVVMVLRSGGCYDGEYVKRLVTSLRHNITYPHKISLLTDFDILQVPENIHVIPLKKDFTGWWSKLELFDNFKGKTVYFDLDTVINGNIDWILRYETRFACLTDLMMPQYFGTGVMVWNGDYSYLSDGFHMTMDSHYRYTGNWGDQGYIVKHLKFEPQRIQDYYPHEIASYKQNTKTQRMQASIICYHGSPRPHETGWEV